MNAEVSIAAIMSRRLTLAGSMRGRALVAFKSLVADEIARSVWAVRRRWALKPVLHDPLFRWRAPPEAHRLMESGDHIGKIVLTT